MHGPKDDGSCISDGCRSRHDKPFGVVLLDIERDGKAAKGQFYINKTEDRGAIEGLMSDTEQEIDGAEGFRNTFFLKLPKKPLAGMKGFTAGFAPKGPAVIMKAADWKQIAQDAYNEFTRNIPEESGLALTLKFLDGIMSGSIIGYMKQLPPVQGHPIEQGKNMSEIDAETLASAQTVAAKMAECQVVTELIAMQTEIAKLGLTGRLADKMKRRFDEHMSRIVNEGMKEKEKGNEDGK